MDGQSGSPGLNLGNRYGHTSDCMALSSNFNNNEFVPIVQIDYTAGECWLLGGFRKFDLKLGNDTLLVQPLFMIEMTLTNLPVIDLPPNPGLVGTSLYLQSFLYNPAVYPNDPIMLSEGLDYKIGISTTAYGQGSGLRMWPIGQIIAQPGGKIEINFSLP